MIFGNTRNFHNIQLVIQVIYQAGNINILIMKDQTDHVKCIFATIQSAWR
ncbi:hypothetical protein B5790_2058 [Bifidobacterium dentium]|nr:hypothetical protein B5790_2058 [Bifidobacterium dentium]